MNIGFVLFFSATASDSVMALNNWVGPIGVALLALGLLRSHLVAPWIAGVGLAEGIGSAAKILVPWSLSVGGVRVGSILGFVYWAVVLVFLFGLAASLLRRTEVGRLDAEQALQPGAPKVGIES